MSEPLIEWQTLEYHHRERTKDWYWGVAIISITIAVLAVILKQPLFALFIIVATGTLLIKATQTPKTLTFSINDRGIVIDDTLYPFLNIESFCVISDEYDPKILVKSTKTLMPLIAIPIDEVDPEAVREILLKYIAEEEHNEPLGVKILERLGF